MTVCDLCGSGQYVFWEWETPNRAPSLEEAQRLDMPWFEDPIWCVCDTCHRMVLAGKPEALLERGIALIEQANPGSFYAALVDGVLHKVEPRESAANTHAMFWQEKTTFRRIA